MTNTWRLKHCHTKQCFTQIISHLLLFQQIVYRAIYSNALNLLSRFSIAVLPRFACLQGVYWEVTSFFQGFSRVFPGYFSKIPGYLTLLILGLTNIVVIIPGQESKYLKKVRGVSAKLSENFDPFITKSAIFFFKPPFSMWTSCLPCKFWIYPKFAW